MASGVGLSLRSKSVLFLIGYTLVLEGSILIYFYYSGKDTIRHQSYQEVRAQAVLARSAVENALAGTLAELAGLRPQLLLYPMPAGLDSPRLEPAEELVAALPQKYAEIGLLDRGARRMLAVRAVREFNRIYPIVETRTNIENIADECPPSAGEQRPDSPCILGLQLGARGGLVEIIVPLAQDRSRVLVAQVYLNSLLESINTLPMPSHLSIIAADRQGLIHHAPNVSLLRTYLQNTVPDLGFAPGAELASEREAQGIPGRTIYWEHLPRLDIQLVVQKDDRDALQELMIKLIKAASFTALITLVAFVGVGALTGRIAASLRHVTEVADNVANGNFSQRIAIRRNDELGILISRFNGMIEKLAGSYRTLQEVNQQLQSKVEELSRTRLRLTQKQRLALVGEAISKASHEIQNKIGGVSVWVQNLERLGAKDENTALCIRELKAALASSMGTLVHFKRFYREPQLQKRKVPATELINICLGRVSTELQAKGLHVLTDLREEAAAVEVDTLQMSDAMVNILLNGAYFSPERGSLMISLARDEENIVFSFCDQGPGFQDKEKLFQPFYTTKPNGSGLGLAIVRNIVKAHSGHIRAYNCAAGGACIEILLPLVREQSEAVCNEPSETGATTT